MADIPTLPSFGLPTPKRSTPEKPSRLDGVMLLWSILALLATAAAASMVHDLAGFAVLGLGCAALVQARHEHPHDVLGIIYIAFCASPFLRRLHDFQHGFNPFSTLLLSPYVALLPLVPIVIRRLPLLRRQHLIPMVLVLIGVLIPFLVGVWNLGIQSATIGLVEWSSGPAILLYLLLLGRPLDYKRFGVWLLLIMAVEAVYGLYQWASPPPWDAKWLVDSRMTSSMGQPEPFLMRTFGTLNSTGIYSFYCTFFLVCGLGWRLYPLVAIPVVAALATTQVRAAWAISALGLVVVLLLQPGKQRLVIAIRIAVVALILGVFGAPLLAKYGNLTKRFQTLSSISSDGSYNERKQMSSAFMEIITNLPEGAGLGTVGRGAKVTKNGIAGLDNGFVAMFYMMGWVPATLYLGGFLYMLLVSLAYGDPSRVERAAMGGIALVLFLSNAFGASFSDIGGIVSWSSLGIAYSTSFRRHLYRV